MKRILWILLWVVSGVGSFVLTQTLIKGWDYVKNAKLSGTNVHIGVWFLSAAFMGPLNIPFCINTIIKYYRRNKNE